jgi:hypothetical protein
MKNKKGQTIMIGIMVMVMAILIFIATIPALASMFNTARQCDSLNCDGYIDPDASGAACTSSNRSYDATLNESTLACTILDLGIPYLILGVLVGLIAKLIHGKLVEPAPEPSYGGYGGY